MADNLREIKNSKAELASILMDYLKSLQDVSIDINSENTAKAIKKSAAKSSASTKTESKTKTKLSLLNQKLRLKRKQG